MTPSKRSWSTTRPSGGMGRWPSASARLFRAVKPDPAVNEFQPICILLAVIAEKIRSLAGPVDISEVMADVEELLDRSIDAKGYAIQGESAGGSQPD